MSRSRALRAWAVLDLGFGDAGKGLLTDYLVRTTGASVVVRFNGGAQAGHNVVTPDGRHHTFAQFGAGTFVPGVQTFLSRHVLLHPGALLYEGAALRQKGVTDAFERIRISRGARVITPLHQSANRLRELARGALRHGSCGVGIGETVADALSHPEDTLFAGDLLDIGWVRRKLGRIRERKRAELLELLGPPPSHLPATNEWQVFERDDILENWLDQLRAFNDLGLVAPDSVLGDWCTRADSVVFEGAQGILLDEERGFHPHTTWSRCTAENALELLAELPRETRLARVGVLRSHAVRHGPGPLPTELRAPPFIPHDHNAMNDWQGAVRYGWFDAVLARYALAASGGVDALAMTHLDLIPRIARPQICVRYENLGELEAPSTDLQGQAELGKALERARPELAESSSDPAAYLAHLERLLERNVTFASYGPCATDVAVRAWSDLLMYLRTAG